MGYHKDTGSYSKRILIIIGAFYLLNYMVDGKLYDIFALIPAFVTDNVEFWRLITFPLAPGTIEGLLIFAFVFYLIAPKLEDFIRNSLFLALLVPVIFLQGCIHTLTFWHTNQVLTGLEGLSFFVILLFTLLNPKQKVKFRFLPSFSILSILVFITISWVSLKLIVAASLTGEVFLREFSTMIFGYVLGTITYLQYKLLNRFLSRKERKTIPEIPEPEELKLAMISQAKLGKHTKESLDEDFIEIDEDPVINAQKLDNILDKMNEFGKESLSPDEIEFLKRYSKLL